MGKITKNSNLFFQGMEAPDLQEIQTDDPPEQDGTFYKGEIFHAADFELVGRWRCASDSHDPLTWNWEAELDDGKIKVAYSNDGNADDARAHLQGLLLQKL